MLVVGVIAVVVAIVVALLMFSAMRRPDTFTVERRATIHAEPHTIFALLNDFHEWGKWSPWEHLDPNMTRTHGGPDSGVGASYAWSGNKRAGQGRMEILKSEPPSRLEIDLSFIKPFPSKNITTFTLTPTGGGTEVHWHMQGPASLMTKVFDMLMNMDKMVGKDFEQGLANLKKVTEKA